MSEDYKQKMQDAIRDAAGDLLSRLAAGEIPLHVRAIRQRPCFPRNQYLWSRVFVYAVAPVCLSL